LHKTNGRESQISDKRDILQTSRFMKQTPDAAAVTALVPFRNCSCDCPLASWLFREEG